MLPAAPRPYARPVPAWNVVGAIAVAAGLWLALAALLVECAP